MSFDPKAPATDDIDNLEVGNYVWIKARVTSVDSYGEIAFEAPYTTISTDEKNPHAPRVAEEMTTFTMYEEAIKWNRGEATPPAPGDIVYVQGSPGAFGKLMTVVKGQGVIDFSYDNPAATAALSTLSMGVIRRQGE